MDEGRRPFQPVNGHPMWVLIKDRLVGMNIGDVITDGELRAAVPEGAPASINSAFHRAVRSLQETHSRTLTRVRKVGYRMVAATEHEKLARDQQRRGYRRLVASRGKLASADRTQLNREDRQRVDALQHNADVQAEFVRRNLRKLDKRVTRLELDHRAHRRQTSGDIAALSSKVDKLMELMERGELSTFTED